MNIRTITTGFGLNLPLRQEEIRVIANFSNDAKRILEDSGYRVQTVRMATQPWDEYFESRGQIIKLVKDLENSGQKLGIDYISIGTTDEVELIPLIYDIIKSTSNIFCTVLASNNKQINYRAIRESAIMIKKISMIRADGFDNLRFAVLFNVKPGTPFFPASYHRGPISFALATESSDLLNKAFSKANDIKAAKQFLEQILTEEFGKLEEIALQISDKGMVRYDGIDVSIATSVRPDESIAYAFEKLGLGNFGEAGTLTIARMITKILKELNIRKCGYSGLMLPVLEDYGLAERNINGNYNIANLMLYSSVCGTGLDTIPLPGNVSEKKLYALLLDIASLSVSLNKPLSARLMPIADKKIGDMTDFKFEYFVNSKVMRI